MLKTISSLWFVWLLLEGVVISGLSYATENVWKKQYTKEEPSKTSDELKDEILQNFESFRVNIMLLSNSVLLNQIYEKIISDCKSENLNKTNEEVEKALGKMSQYLNDLRESLEKEQEEIKRDYLMILSDVMNLNQVILRAKGANKITLSKEIKLWSAQALDKLSASFFERVEFLLQQNCLTQAYYSSFVGEHIYGGMKEEWAPFERVAAYLDGLGIAFQLKPEGDQTEARKLKKYKTTWTCPKLKKKEKAEG